MGRNVVGWISTLWRAAHPGGYPIFQFSKDFAERKGEDKNHRKEQAPDEQGERSE